MYMEGKQLEILNAVTEKSSMGKKPGRQSKSEVEM